MARKRVLLLLVAVFAVAGASVAVAQASTGGRSHHHDGDWGGGGQGGGGAGGPRTTTPIKHLVVIFQENVSFDHYFGTYPHAANTDGQPFYASPRTPTVNGLSGALLTNNPNLSNPQRLSYSQAATCDQDHDYTDEQSAFDHGLMDMFVQKTGSSLTLAQCLKNEGNPAPAGGTDPNYAVMDYYDGNTVTGLWNYAQHFAMSDNSYGTNFGRGLPGHRPVLRERELGHTDSRPSPAGGARNRVQRFGSGLRRVLGWQDHRHGRQEHRRPARPVRDQLGMVRGRLRQPGLRARPAEHGRPDEGLHDFS
jgi:hypothetical protein